MRIETSTRVALTSKASNGLLTRERERERQTERERETDRQTDRQTNRQTHKQRQRERDYKCIDYSISQQLFILLNVLFFPMPNLKVSLYQ